MLRAIGRKHFAREVKSDEDLTIVAMMSLHLALAHFDKLEPFWTKALMYSRKEQLDAFDQLDGLVKVQLERINPPGA